MCLLSVVTIQGFAANIVISLKDHYPQNYVVQENDTIYEIASMYLNKPWQWKRIWRDNLHVKNPKRLYPGTVLELQYHDGKPRLTVTRTGTYKLSPHARPRPAQKAIPPIHLRDIEPFLNRSLVLDEDELKKAGYVIAFKGNHLMGGQSDQIYAQNLYHKGMNKLSFAIYRENGVYKNTKDPTRCLGYKAMYIGDAELVKSGNPATLELTEISKGVKIKDRILPNDKSNFDLYFEPQAPKKLIGGEIIDIIGGLDQVARDQIIVIDRGKVDKLEAGDVIAVWRHKRLIQDPLDKDNIITLPRERLGEAMIFNTFTFTSYALVVRADRAIKVGDNYSNP